MAVASGYEVVNDKGDRAWFDDTTGQVFPIPPKMKVEPGTQLQKGDIERGINQTQAIQTLGVQEDARNVKRQAAIPDETRTQQVQQSLHATQPYKVVNDKGDEGMFDPNTGAITPVRKQEPLFMEKYGLGAPPGKELQQKLSGPIASFMVGANPYGRVANAAISAGTSAVEDIAQGKTPSVPGMVTAGIGGAISPEIAKAGKAIYRTAGSVFGRGPLKAAAGEIYDTTKGLAKATGTTETENAIMDQIATFGRTAPEQSRKVVTDIFDKVVGSKIAGKPLSYGEVFNNATQLNQHIDELFRGKFKEAAGQLKTIKDAMMNDLAQSGPEAADAVKAYSRAVGAFGGYGGVVQAVKKIVGAGTGGAAMIAAAIKPSTMWVSAPAALIGGIANLTQRLPFGIGEGIAKALVTDPGKISLGAARAVVNAINEQAKEY